MSALGHAVGGHDRQIANAARVGTVQEIQGNQARVAIGETLTDWMYWTSRRAYDAYDYDTLTVGEQVVVLTLWGDVSQGVILGAIPQDAQAAPSSGNVWSKRFKDGATITYDPATHTLDVEAKDSPIIINCHDAKIVCQSSVTIDSPTVNLTGSLSVGKDISVSGKVSVDGDVTAGGKSLETHTHPIASSSMTGPPK